MNNNHKISVLLCTHNGEKFIEEQIKSIFKQKERSIKIFISDDNSQDKTINILRKFSSKSNVDLKFGPQKGATENFLSLIRRDDIESDYFAFSDQDDIWLENHIHRAINSLEQVPNNIPALFASRTILINESGHTIGKSPRQNKKASFQNAIIQNIASGNTMVFNRAARNLLIKMTAVVKPIWHDWALYQAVSACNGTIFYSQIPSVLYRQHESNLIGAKTNLTTKIKRAANIINGRFKSWNKNNIELLTSISDEMSQENIKILEKFKALRTEKNPMRRIILLKESGIYRQDPKENIALFFCAILGII